MQNQSTELIVKDFELEKQTSDEMSEEEFFVLLSKKIAYMIEYQLDMLLSLMYRLDIDEHKINAVLMPNSLVRAEVGLAHLVIERQKQRVASKNRYQSPPIDEEWAF